MKSPFCDYFIIRQSKELLLGAYKGLINTNRNGSIHKIIRNIKDGIERIFVIPRNHVVKDIRGHLFIAECQEEDIDLLEDIFQRNNESGHLKLRSKEYFSEHHKRFFLAKKQNILVGCMEMIPIDNSTLELGGLIVDREFVNARIGIALIEMAEQYAYIENKHLIVITNYPRLKKILIARGYMDGGYIYKKRLSKSPGKDLFFLDASKIGLGENELPI